MCTACLYVAGDVTFSSLATASIIVVLVAMVSSLTVLPHCWPRWDGGSTGAGTTGPSWRRAGMADALSARHPLPTLLVAVAAMLALAAPAGEHAPQRARARHVLA
jgi:RND superfamily putative drug exporter